MKNNLSLLLEFLFKEQVEAETKPREKIGPSKSYRWKEELMQAVQKALEARAVTIENQEEFQAVIDEEIEKLRRDIEMTLEMIARTLYQVPFQAFKRK